MGYSFFDKLFKTLALMCSLMFFFMIFLILQDVISTNSNEKSPGPTIKKILMEYLTDQGWKSDEINGYQYRIIRDTETGCQYFKYTYFSAPRYGKDGRIMGCGDE